MSRSTSRMKSRVLGNEAELALNGGEPARGSLLPYGRQSIDETDIAHVVDVLKSDWLTTGPKVDEFEEAVAGIVGARYAIAFSSGTAALHGAAYAAGIGRGDLAITSPLTFCATANCVLYQGGTPLFIDIEDDYLTMDPERLGACKDDRIKAVLPIDFSGHPAHLDQILDLANERGWIVIEDACHALGARDGNKNVGSISDMSIFSFHPVKHIATGEGGMVTTDDLQLAESLKAFRSHGIERPLDKIEGEPWYYEMNSLGYNYRISDIACALGISQLRTLDERLQRRAQIAKAYDAALFDIEALRLPRQRDGVCHAWHLYVVRVREELLSVGRAEIFKALRAENIGVQVHYIPVHLHPYYSRHLGFERGMFPIAEAAYDASISLPIWPGMSDRDTEDVIRAVNKVIHAYTI